LTWCFRHRKGKLRNSSWQTSSELMLASPNSFVLFNGNRLGRWWPAGLALQPGLCSQNPATSSPGRSSKP
jgi:hypothetical protein